MDRRRVIAGALGAAAWLAAGAAAGVLSAWAGAVQERRERLGGVAPAAAPVRPPSDAAGRWPAPVPEGWPPPDAVAVVAGPARMSLLATQAVRRRGVVAVREASRTEYGWPRRSMWAWTTSEPGPWSRGEPGPTVRRSSPSVRAPLPASWGSAVRLPVLVLWPGMIANALAYAGALWAVARVPALARRWARRRAGRCERCGYDRRGLGAGAACPECGRPAPPARVAPQ